MIHTKTVFVLGAGASAPYGFPLGRTLVEMICHDLESASVMLTRVHALGHGLNDIHRFRDELVDAGPDSIDAFLQTRPRYLELGKACIATALIPFEREDELRGVRTTRDVSDEAVNQALSERRSRRWYHYLFNHMLTTKFEKNHLAVITFNFDRSFERALYRVLRANSDGSESDVRRLCDSVPVVHVHGRLGTPSWLEPDATDARPFGSSAPITTDDVRQIRLVTDEIEHEVTAAVRRLLEDATNVCFLGFSYHPINLAKIQHRNLLGRAKTLMGTAFKMPLGPYAAMWREFDGQLTIPSPLGGGPYDRNCDILMFLQETEVIHERPE